MFSIFKDSDFLRQNTYSQSWDSARKWRMCGDRLDRWVRKTEWQRWNRLPTYCVNWVCNTLMKQHNGSARDWRDPRRGQLPPGHSELPEADSLCLRSDPPRDVPGRGGVVNVLQSCSGGPRGPGLPHWGQCSWYLWWLFRNPYLIDNTYP